MKFEAHIKDVKFIAKFNILFGNRLTKIKTL